MCLGNCLKTRESSRQQMEAVYMLGYLQHVQHEFMLNCGTGFAGETGNHRQPRPPQEDRETLKVTPPPPPPPP